MHSTSIISFLLLLLTPLFVFAQDATTTAPSAAETSLSSTTTVRTTVTSTQVTFVTMTGVPPSSTSVTLIPPSSSYPSSAIANATTTVSKPSISATGNGTSLATGSPSAVPFVGAAPGAFRVSAGMGAVVLGAAFWLL